MRPGDDHRGAADGPGAGPGEIPRRLCAVAVELLPVTGASVSLHDHDIPVQVCASDARAAYATDIQATLGDGPCQSAARSRRPVLASDLTEGRDAERWPVFAEEAAEIGVRATYSLPLGDDMVCVGTLDLYRDTPGELTADELRTARALAGALTMALMELTRETGDGTLDLDRSGWLGGLATEQDSVYQAIGMIMAQLGVGASEALALLRARAFAQSRTAAEVARDVVGHRLRFSNG